MKKTALYIFLFFLIVIYSSCSHNLTLGEKYADLYKEQPLSILIMAPINETNFVEAKDYFYTALYIPLCEKGYYVYSPSLTMEMLKTESAYDSELFLNGNLKPFEEFVGADAVLFTIIKEWSRNNIGGNIKVDIEYILRSTKTGKTLYKKEGKIKLDTKAHTGFYFTNLLFNTITTAKTDKVEAGRACTRFVLTDMPSGKYSPLFGIDSINKSSKDIIITKLKK